MKLFWLLRHTHGYKHYLPRAVYFTRPSDINENPDRFFFRFPFTSVIQKTYYKSRVKNTIGMKLVAETKSNKRNARLRKPDSNIMMAVYYVILDITICLRCCICVCITFNMICNFQLLCQMSVYKTFPRWLIFLQ